MCGESWWLRTWPLCHLARLLLVGSVSVAAFREPAVSAARNLAINAFDLFHIIVND